MDNRKIEEIVQNVLQQYEIKDNNRRYPIALEPSARHVHLNASALEVLFGKGAQLKVIKQLSQPGEFLSDKRVRISTAKGELSNIAVLGPLRAEVQVELSRTDCYNLGIDAPINLSGDLSNAGSVYIIGGHGMMEAKNSVIVARAHIHLRPIDAKNTGLIDGQIVEVDIESNRPLKFCNVIVRVNKDFAPAMHIDLDEANACAYDKHTKAYICLTGKGAR